MMSNYFGCFMIRKEPPLPIFSFSDFKKPLYTPEPLYFQGLRAS